MTTKKFQTVLFASLIVAMILPFSVMNLADAAPNGNVNDKIKEKLLKKVEKYDYKIKNQLAKSEQDKIHQKIKADKKTAQLFKNRVIAMNDEYSYHGNVYELDANPNKKLDIVMHYALDDESASVLVDGETNNIVEYRVLDMKLGLLPDNGLIVSEYGGSAIDGIRMNLYALSFSHNGVGW